MSSEDGLGESIEVAHSVFDENSIYTSIPDPSMVAGEEIMRNGKSGVEEPPDITQSGSNDSAEAVASRRNCYIIIAILALGAAAIATTLAIILPQQLNKSSNGSGSDGVEGTVPTPIISNTAFPTVARTDSPTPRPTTPEPSSMPSLEPLSSMPSLGPLPSTAPSGAPSTPAPTSLPPVSLAPVPLVGGPTIAPSPNFTFNFVPTFSETPNTAAPITAAPITRTPSTMPSARPTSQLQVFLETVALEGGAEFDNPNSYQSGALAWLEASDTSTLSNDRIAQRYALGCMHTATFGVLNPWMRPGEEEGWGDATGWLTNADECTWYGITCNANQQVQVIDLHGNNVTGSWPSETLLLQDSLQVLDIGNNNVWNRNEEIDFIGELTNLIELDIGVTYFQYNGIPEVFGKLVNLEMLDIAYTLFFGPIRGPEVFANLEMLTQIEMGGNSYNQSIPAEIANLPLLTNFYCDNAFLEGDVEFILDMPVIFEIWLDDNPDLGGTIPTELGAKFNTLQSISFTECSFTGTIPTELGTLLRMQQIWLFDNALTGTVPTEIGGLQFLTVFDASLNPLSGNVPDSICGLTSGVLADVCVECEFMECCCCTCCESSTCA